MSNKIILQNPIFTSNSSPIFGYGPYDSLENAIKDLYQPAEIQYGINIPAVDNRYIGMTVAIKADGKVVEYVITELNTINDVDNLTNDDLSCFTKKSDLISDEIMNEDSESAIKTKLTALEGNFTTVAATETTPETTYLNNVKVNAADVVGLDDAISDNISGNDEFENIISNALSNNSQISGLIDSAVERHIGDNYVDSEEFDALSGRVEDIEGNYTTMNSDITALTTTVNTNTTGLGALDSRVTTVEGEYATMNGSIATLTNAVGNSDSGLVHDVDGLAGRVTTIEDEYVTMNGSIATLTTTVNGTDDGEGGHTGGLVGTVGTLTGKINGIETDYATMNGSITALTTTVNGADDGEGGHTGGLVDTVGTLNDSLGDLVTVVSGADGHSGLVANVNDISDSQEFIGQNIYDVTTTLLGDLNSEVANYSPISESQVLKALEQPNNYYYAFLTRFKETTLGPNGGTDGFPYTSDVIVDLKSTIIHFNEELSSDETGINKYVYLIPLSDNDSGRDMINYYGQFNMFVVDNSGEDTVIKELALRKNFPMPTDLTMNDNGIFTNSDYYKLISSTNNNEKTWDDTNSTLVVCNTAAGNSGLTDRLVKIYTTAYKYKLVTQFKETGETGDSYKDIFVSNSNYIQVNPEIVETVRYSSNGTNMYDYVVKDEYIQDDGDVIEDTITGLAASDSNNFIYLVLTKDGRIGNGGTQLGFTFKQFVYYNNQVQRMLGNKCIEYGNNPHTVTYETPVDITSLTNNNAQSNSSESTTRSFTANSSVASYNFTSTKDVVDNILYKTETIENREEITPEIPEVPAVYKFTILNDGFDTAVVDVDKIQTIKNEVITVLTENGIQKPLTPYKKYTDPYFQLSNYFTFSTIYNDLSNDQVLYLSILEDAMITINQLKTQYGLPIAKAMVMTLNEFGITNDSWRADNEDVNNTFASDDENTRRTISFMYNSINNNTGDGNMLFNNMCRINNYYNETYNNVDSVNVFITFLCYLQKLVDEDFKTAFNTTFTTLGQDSKHIIYKGTAKLWLVKVYTEDTYMSENNFIANYSKTTEVATGIENTTVVAKAYAETDITNLKQIQLDKTYFETPISDIQEVSSYEKISTKGLKFATQYQRNVASIPGVYRVSVVTTRSARSQVEINAYFNAKGMDSAATANWFNYNNVIPFLVKKVSSTNSSPERNVTNTFEYRTWDKFKQEWVDLGMETVTITGQDTNDWTLWAPKPEIDDSHVSQRINSRSEYENSQLTNFTQTALRNDILLLVNNVNELTDNQNVVNSVVKDYLEALTAKWTENNTANAIDTSSLIALNTNSGTTISTDNIVSSTITDVKPIKQTATKIDLTSTSTSSDNE